MARSSFICFRLEKLGVRARSLSFVESSWKRILLREAAVKAGLGIMGKNNLLVTPRFGPRVRLTAIFTDADIKPDSEISEDFCLNCDLCIKSCPTGALSENGFSRNKCIAEFDPDEEMLKLQREKVKYITNFTRLQCRICMDVCPVGKNIEIENIDGF
jgi:epoxyqueuosine reductase QueG